MKPSGNRGVVLLVVLAVLLVLALLATVFATLSSIERAVSRNYTDDVRAKLLAQSGVEHAVVRLRELLPKGFFAAGGADQTWVYYGSEVVETNPPNPLIPVEKALNPSFAYEFEAVQNPYDANAAPRTFSLDGQPVGFSGVMDSGTYGKNADQYVLRVTDTGGQINVNDGVAWGPGHSVSQNLKRILNVLGAQPAVNVPNLGNLILAKRPPGGYQSKYELLASLNYDDQAFNRVRDFVTTHSWTDPNVANPVPLSSAVSDPSGGIYRVSYARPTTSGVPVYRYGRNKNWLGQISTAPLLFHTPTNGNPFHNAIYGVDELHPQWIETVSRAPVNVNTARKEVLLALLIDLEGFFVVERRRDNPYSPPSAGFGWANQSGGYTWLNQKLTYDASPGPTGTSSGEGDECGFIYRTVPLIGAGGQSTTGIAASVIADEIIACRGKKPSPNIAGLDYATVPFGGPFRSWAQFNLFVDNLVRGGVLADTRPNIFWDYDSSGTPIMNSAAQRRIASQAIADALKANFNPNLHLNELNPDRNLFTLVDKTDLVVASTEFCFTPMGTFEIESLGRVVRPKDSDDAFTASNSTLVAHKKVLAMVRLFDAVRQTSQAHFYAGDWSNRTTWPETNNNRALETGPEVDNGPQPSEARWSGYIALPTIGGNRGNSFEWGTQKPKNALWTTYPTPGVFPGCTNSINGGAQFGSVIHSHFQLDGVAHHHMDKTALPGAWDGFKLPLGGWWLVYDGRASIAMNWEDRTEPILSPYTPADSGFVPCPAPYTHRYRLGRAFQMPLFGSGTTSAPTGFYYSPSDLRVDGAYCERGSAIGYWITEDTSFNFNEGTASFWVKPNFYPECTGKPRTLWSVARYHNYNPGVVNFSPFTLFFFPAHDSPSGSGSAYEDPAAPSYYGGIGKFRPASLAFGYGFHPATGYNWETSGPNPSNYASSHANVVTPTLNHELHGANNWNPMIGDDGKFNWLRAHEWTHVTVTWKITPGQLQDAQSVMIYVNGQILPGTVGIPSYYGPTSGEPIPFNPMWYIHSLIVGVPGFGTKWAANCVRLGGEISKPLDTVWGLPGSIYPRNYTADMTFDEFYLWNNRATTTGGGLASSQTIWYRGRYYKPSDTNAADSVFTSATITLAGPGRWLPSSTGIPAPDGTAPSTGATAPPPSKKRILGVSWTAYAEEYDRVAGLSGAAVMRPKMFDYATTPPGELRPAAVADANGYVAESIADVWLQIDSAAHGPYRNEGYSPVLTSSGTPVTVQTSLKYQVKLKIGPKTPSTILLATPVFDDVTIFYDTGDAEFVGWLMVNTTQ